jgi:hypothetical protein
MMSLFSAVQYVGSGLSLIAFITAAGVVAYVARLKQRAKIIGSAPSKDRLDAIAMAAEFFPVKSSNLSSEQQREIVLAQIKMRARRETYVAAVCLLASLLFAIVAIVALERSQSAPTQRPDSSLSIDQSSDAQRTNEARPAFNPVPSAIHSSIESRNYDLSKDFGTINNINSAWSVDKNTTRLLLHSPLKNGNPFELAFINGIWGEGPNTWRDTPIIFKAAASGAAVTETDNDFLVGDVLVHSPNDSSAVLINWTAPSNGSVDFVSSIWYAHSIVRRSDDFHILVDGAVVNSGTVSNASHSGRSDASIFRTKGLKVMSGEKISVEFTKSSGQAAGSLSGLSETISFTAATQN